MEMTPNSALFDSRDLEEILDTVDSQLLQAKINKQLIQLTSCANVLQTWIITENNESCLQVIGSNILPREIKVLVASDEILLRAIKGETNIDNDLRTTLQTFLSPWPKCFDHLQLDHPDDNRKGKISLLICFTDCPNFAGIKNEVVKFLRLVRGSLFSAFELREERRRKELCQALLAISKNLFLNLGDLEDLMQEIISEARKLVGAERCSLFLVSDDKTELVAKVFDGIPRDKAQELRMPIHEGVAGHVATTGEILNIRDAYEHPLFYKKIDESTGYITRNILCFPIRDSQDLVVGVAQLCNKPSGFTALDEEAATALATYCGISLMHSIVYKKIVQSQARIRLANELQMYHMGVSEDAVLEVIQSMQDHDLTDMLDWKWPCRDISIESTPCLALGMFESLGLLQTFHISRTTAARFILMVRKGYRDVPYHNWVHAFSFTHFAYYAMKHLRLLERSWLTNLEGVALLVAALCHDIDHRGTNNSFQTKAQNTLACLYSSEGSVMERHHFAQTLCILNTEGCNIFENLTTHTYRQVLDLIRDLILATDLATHLSKLQQQKSIAGSYNPERIDHRSHLLSLIVTSADLNDQIKDWQYTHRVANLIYAEFFTQGDLEKAMGVQPIAMMDRDLAEIPTLQVEFLTSIALPCYRVFCLFFPSMESLLHAVTSNLERWKAAKRYFDLPEHEGRLPLDLLNDPKFLAYVLKN